MKIEGHKAVELSEVWGIAVSTIYNWKEAPKWAKAYLHLEGKYKKLQDENRALRGLLKETS